MVEEAPVVVHHRQVLVVDARPCTLAEPRNMLQVAVVAEVV